MVLRVLYSIFFLVGTCCATCQTGMYCTSPEEQYLYYSQYVFHTLSTGLKKIPVFPTAIVLYLFLKSSTVLRTAVRQYTLDTLREIG